MIIDNDKLAFLATSPGAFIRWLEFNGKKFFYPQTTMEKGGQKISRGGMHICSPIFGSPEDKGIFSNAPQHGELRDEDWSVLISEQNSYCYFGYDYDKHGESISYGVKFFLDDNRLIVTTDMMIFDDIVDHADIPVKIPIELGWHPYFYAPNGGTVQLGNLEPINIRETYGPKIFDSPEKAIIELPGVGRVIMEYGEGFQNGKTCIWTDWLGPYFCVEPLLSYRDQFDTEDGVFLESDKEPMVAEFSMVFED